MDTVNVFVDDRENSSPLLASLQTNPKLCITVKRLPLGDYQFSNKIIFERKTIFDFAESIIDGRLFSQMCRLINSPIRAVLLLEGTTKDLKNIGVRLEAIQGALIMINIILGIPILRAQNPIESARLMQYAVNQINNSTNLPIPRHIKRPKGKKKLQMYILQGLPGVGPLRAKQLLEKFGNITGVINASFTDLQSINGIGKKIAARMRWAIN